MKILFWFLAFLSIISMVLGFYKETKDKRFFCKHYQLCMDFIFGPNFFWYLSEYNVD